MKRNNIFRTILLLGMILFSTRTWSQTAPETKTKAYVLNYRLDRLGCPLIDVLLTPDITVPFAIDTGAGDSVISDKLAKRLGLTPKPSLDDQGNANFIDGKPAKSVLVHNFPVGPLFFDVNFAVLKTSELANTDDAPANEKVDGIIGYNILRLFATFFDFQAHTMTLWQTEKMTPEQRVAMGMGDAIAVSLVLPDVWAFQVDGTINNQEKVPFLLDTGSDSVVITTEMAQKLHLKPSRPSIMVATTLGKIKFDVSRIDTLSFGSLVLKDLEVQYPHKRIDYTTQLGMGVLSKFRLLLDYPQHMAYFKPIEAPKTDAPKASEKP